MKHPQDAARHTVDKTGRAVSHQLILVLPLLPTGSFSSLLFTTLFHIIAVAADRYDPN